MPVEARLPFSACLPAELTSSCASQPHFVLSYCTQSSLEGKITCAAPSESSDFGADGLRALLYLGTSTVRALGCIILPSCFRREALLCLVLCPPLPCLCSLRKENEEQKSVFELSGCQRDSEWHQLLRKKQVPLLIADWRKHWLLSHASGGLDTAAGCSVMMLLVNNYLLTAAGTVHKAALCS